MTTKFKLAAHEWAGWVESPLSSAFGAAGPILLTEVTPLKTGTGHLRIAFLQPLAPRGCQRRNIVLQVVQHSAEHLVGFYDDNASSRTAIIAASTLSWIDNYCRFLRERREVEYWQNAELPANRTGICSYLSFTLGRNEEEVLSGVKSSSFGCTLKPMPKKHAILAFDAEYESLDALLISRGRVPYQMEDKWFIFLEEGRLRFHRSWTGTLIYEIEAAWHGSNFRLGRAKVNRKASEYSETDDVYDLAILRWLVDVKLCGLRSDYPRRTQESEHE